MEIEQFDSRDQKDMKKTVLDSEENASMAPPAYYTKDTTPFALISFHTFDRIRLIQLPESEIDRIHECVRRNWEPGVSSCESYNASKELKLKQSPWLANHTGNPKVTKLVQAILAETYEMGWRAEQGIVVCKKADQKDTVLLRRAGQATSSASWLSISFDQHNVVTVHGGSSEVRQCLIARFSAQDWSAESAYMEDRMEIRLKKPYWISQGEDTVKARLMLLEIAQVLDLFGFKIYISLRLSNVNDVLFCIKEDRDTLL